MRAITELFEKKRQREPITMVSVYDAVSARICAEAGIDILLVGDSLSMTALGRASTVPTTVEEMLHHTKAARNGAPDAIIIADMPFMSFQRDPLTAIDNAARFIKEGGANGVKVEGASERILMTIKSMTESGIEVMGHIGLTPQTIPNKMGYKVQWKDDDESRIIRLGKELEKSGVFAVVVECAVESKAKALTQALSCPVIGIGAGRYVDGQVLVFNDIVGLTTGKAPRFVKSYADGYSIMQRAICAFKEDVQNRRFPTEDHIYAG